VTWTYEQTFVVILVDYIVTNKGKTQGRTRTNIILIFNLIVFSPFSMKNHYLSHCLLNSTMYIYLWTRGQLDGYFRHKFFN
jgi:hypothetical protein